MGVESLTAVSWWRLNVIWIHQGSNSEKQFTSQYLKIGRSLDANTGHLGNLYTVYYILSRISLFILVEVKDHLG